MPRAGTNHVTSVASGWLLRRDAKPVTVNVPFGVQVLPERLLVARSSQFNPRKPAPGELRNGPAFCALGVWPCPRKRHRMVRVFEAHENFRDVGVRKITVALWPRRRRMLPRQAARLFAIRFFPFSALLPDDPSSRFFSLQLSAPGASRSAGLSALCSWVSRSFSDAFLYR